MSSGVQTDEQPTESIDQRRTERLLEREKLRTSRFDAVTSLFMALILFIGTFVLMMFLIWVFSRLEFPPKPIKPIIENPAGRGENAEGFERDFEPPGAEEVEELLEPTLQDTIQAVTDAISNIAASLDTMNTSLSGDTLGSGRGDSRPPGPMGEGADIVPRGERWRLNFNATSLANYAGQLDFYKIELGAIGGSIQGVDVAGNLAGSPQKRRIVDTENEKRLYFMWTTPSPLMQYDRQLLQKAAIPLPNRQMLKFIPEQLENQLAQIEIEYATAKGHPSITEVAKTIFESKADGNGFKFEVIDQRYRKSRKVR
ncbi:hypothetical protein [Novipirellula artificiosorum]|uniref:Uncharacterized protein n=1 Tax=Novipirellula artificiosorum TaxID=2528016 RepID=A0A5C6DHJ7_9BACT|nr:hypothetical protein [Novipirellula artificiosorum]TWU34516.1 hypothetical protein Poly41_46640 [Novipirellula artificiosorum]